jgi:hypothetical protein
MPAQRQLAHHDSSMSRPAGAGPRRAKALPVGHVQGQAVIRPVAAAAPAGPHWPAGRGYVVVPRVGLVFPRRLPFPAWLAVGAQLAAVAASSAWCLGDWLIYGQAAYASRYQDAVERTGLEYQTLRNYAWVAGRFELSRRRDTLSFGHHAEVAALPEAEQDYWLRKADEFRWSTTRLRREVRASLAERQQRPQDLHLGPGGRPGAGRQRTVPVTLTSAQLALCKRAARSQGMTLRLWAARVLEQAAQARLSRGGGEGEQVMGGRGDGLGGAFDVRSCGPAAQAESQG